MNIMVGRQDEGKKDVVALGVFILIRESKLMLLHFERERCGKRQITLEGVSFPLDTLIHSGRKGLEGYTHSSNSMNFACEKVVIGK